MRPTRLFVAACSGFDSDSNCALVCSLHRRAAIHAQQGHNIVSLKLTSRLLYLLYHQMQLHTHSVYLNEETLRVFYLRPTITDILLFLRNLNVAISAVWEGVGSIEIDELRRKKAPGVGINHGGELIDLCYQRCSDDLNVNCSYSLSY